jgi:hypothetical protein
MMPMPPLLLIAALLVPFMFPLLSMIDHLVKRAAT